VPVAAAAPPAPGAPPAAEPDAVADGVAVPVGTAVLDGDAVPLAVLLATALAVPLAVAVELEVADEDALTEGDRAACTPVTHLASRYATMACAEAAGTSSSNTMSSPRVPAVSEDVKEPVVKVGTPLSSSSVITDWSTTRILPVVNDDDEPAA